MIEFLGYYGLGIVGALVLSQLFRAAIKIMERPLDLEPPQKIPQFKPRHKLRKDKKGVDTFLDS